VRAAVVFLGDRFVPEGEARVAIDDAGYLLGDGVFATMRAHGGVCFRQSEHLARVVRGAELFGIPLPLGVARLAEIADEAASRTGARDAYVRVTLTRGGGGDDEATLSVLARALDVPGEALRASGARVGVVAPRRPPSACADPFVKSTSYAPFVLARRAAVTRGLDEGLQLAVDGSVAGGAMSNVFAVRGNELVTPPLETGARAGVTRGVVMQLAPSLGLTPSEAALTPADLAAADEVFLTSTRIGCLPVAEIDGRPASRHGAPRARGLHDALERLVAEECGRPR
jgi:branched-chain amino acid aminotransferase